MLNSSWFSNRNHFGPKKQRGKKSVWQVFALSDCAPQRYAVCHLGQASSPVSSSTPWGADHDLPGTAWDCCELRGAGKGWGWGERHITAVFCPHIALWGSLLRTTWTPEHEGVYGRGDLPLTGGHREKYFCHLLSFVRRRASSLP